MKKIMAVVTAEPVYSERFSDYVNGSGAFLLRAKPFPTPEAVFEYQKDHGTGSVPIMICDEMLLAGGGDPGPSGTQILLLSETGRGGTLRKYQSGQALLSGILNACADRGLSFASPSSGRELKIYAVRGIGCPLGRLRFSLALSRMLSRRQKTVYLDLREFSGLRCLTGKISERGLSTAIYYLKQGKLDGGRLMGLLEEFGGISYLPPVTSAEDVEMMDGNDMERLFGMFSEETSVGCIVAELPDSPSVSLEMMERSEKIFFVHTDDPAEKEAVSVFREMLGNAGREDLLEKIIVTDIAGESTKGPGAGIDGLIYSETGDMVRRALEI